MPACATLYTIPPLHPHPTGRPQQVGPSPPELGDLQALLTRVHTMLDAFAEEPPFTVQRLCELALEPRKQYSRLDKLVRGRGWHGCGYCG